MKRMLSALVLALVVSVSAQASLVSGLPSSGDHSPLATSSAPVSGKPSLPVSPGLVRQTSEAPRDKMLVLTQHLYDCLKRIGADHSAFGPR